MLRTIWGDDDRYREQYWSQLDGIYFAGDGVRRDHMKLLLDHGPHRRRIALTSAGIVWVLLKLKALSSRTKRLPKLR